MGFDPGSATVKVEEVLPSSHHSSRYEGSGSDKLVGERPSSCYLLLTSRWRSYHQAITAVGMKGVTVKKLVGERLSSCCLFLILRGEERGINIQGKLFLTVPWSMTLGLNAYSNM